MNSASPGWKSAAAVLAIAIFAGAFWDRRCWNAGSPGTDGLTAPPCTLRILPSFASCVRSRRMVSREAPRRPASISTEAFSSFQTISTSLAVAVIGGGVVGCAMARRFTLEGARVALLEKAPDILDGASKANSAILHTGFDAPEGSLELECIREGYREYLEIREELGLVHECNGALVVAWSEAEEAALGAIRARAHANGVGDVEIITRAELSRREPNLSHAARAAAVVPGEGIIDPWSAPHAYLAQALANGARLVTSCEVTGGAFDGSAWQLETTLGPIRATSVINCAGLYGDLVDRALLGEARFRITPRKGQFVVFDKAARDLVRAIILPVPSERTKGIVVFPTVFGNLAVGPTAEDQQGRTDASTDTGTLRALIEDGAAKIPALKDMPVTAVYAGLRPASEEKDYRIATTANMLAESGPRDWKQPGHGEIVCHCELVTRREIEAALEGPLAARSLAGLKRRTRATMGRCQGFYCTARLAELTNGHFEMPLAEEIGHG